MDNQNQLDPEIRKIIEQAEEKVKEGIKKADDSLFNGTGYVVHNYLSLLKDLRKLLAFLNPKEPALFINDVLQLYYTHARRPNKEGEFPLPEVLLDSLNYPEVREKINQIE